MISPSRYQIWMVHYRNLTNGLCDNGIIFEGCVYFGDLGAVYLTGVPHALPLLQHTLHIVFINNVKTVLGSSGVINLFWCHTHQPTCGCCCCIPQVTQCSACLLIELWYTTNSAWSHIHTILLFNCFHIFLLYYLPDRFHLQWFRYGYLLRFIMAIQNPSSVYRYWKEWHFTIRRGSSGISGTDSA